MDLTGHPHDIPLEPPATPWGARILLALVAMLFMLVALACGGNGGGGSRPVKAALPPRIASFAPLSGIAGETTVTLTGTGFAKFTAVKFGSVAATNATGTGDTTITVQVPAGATTGAISVVTALGTHTTAASFTVVPKPLAMPVVNTFDPAEGQVGTTVTLSGIALAGATQVSFGGVAATTFSIENPNTIEVDVPGGAQSGPIAVVTPGGIHTTDATFTVLPTPERHHLPPTVASFSPAGGAPGTRVVLTGTRMGGATQVAFNGRASYRIEKVDEKHLVAFVPLGATTGPVTVSTPGGNGHSSTNFTVLAAAAGSVTFSPDAGAPGDVVLLSGTGLAGARYVSFGGVNAIPEEGGTETGLTVQVPAGAVSGPVTVFTPAGIITSAASFTVNGGGTAPTLPTLVTASPNAGRAGDDVTLTGTGLMGTTLVYFHGARAVRFRAIDDTRLLAEVPAAATDGPVTVVTPVGFATLSGFSVPASLPMPQVTGFSPNTGAPDTQVTILGTNLENAVQVTFGTVPAADHFYDLSGNLVAVVPPDVVQGPIAVETVSGISVSTQDFHPVPPAPPVANGFSPDELVTSDVLEIDGTGLMGVSAVVFTGANNTHVVFDKFAYWTDSYLVVHVPPQAVTGPVALRYQGNDLVLPGTLTIHPSRPIISGFSPKQGIPGTLVTITGTGLDSVDEVTFGGEALDPADWIPSADGTSLRVEIPADAVAGTKGTLAVASVAGTASTDTTFEVQLSRLTALRQAIVADPANLPLLDFPSPGRALPYGLHLPMAPVFHPYYPSSLWLPGNIDEASRPAVPDPAFTVNLQLPDAFYPTLPKGMRNEIERRGFRDKLMIMVTSQHNIWDAARDGYLGNRDDYEFKPQYWLYPLTPATQEQFVTDTAMVQVGLFSPVGDNFARTSGLTLNGLPFGAISDPVEVQLGLIGLDRIGSFFADSSNRLVLHNMNYRASYAFWSLTLAGNTAAATLHLLVNDGDQAILDEIMADGDNPNLAAFAQNIDNSEFTKATALSSLLRPVVSGWQRQAMDQPAADLDRIVLTGDLFSDVTSVQVFDADGNGILLGPGSFRVTSDALMSADVPRETVSLQITSREGVSDYIPVVGASSND